MLRGRWSRRRRGGEGRDRLSGLSVLFQAKRRQDGGWRYCRAPQLYSIPTHTHTYTCVVLQRGRACAIDMYIHYIYIRNKKRRKRGPSFFLFYASSRVFTHTHTHTSICVYTYIDKEGRPTWQQLTKGGK